MHKSDHVSLSQNGLKVSQSLYFYLHFTCCILDTVEHFSYDPAYRNRSLKSFGYPQLILSTILLANKFNPQPLSRLVREQGGILPSCFFPSILQSIVSLVLTTSQMFARAKLLPSLLRAGSFLLNPTHVSNAMSLTSIRSSILLYQHRSRMDIEGSLTDVRDLKDLLLPRTMCQRLAKGVLPANTQIQKDALLAMSKSATVFINYIGMQ